MGLKQKLSNMATNSGIDLHEFITQEQWDASSKFDGTERVLKWVEVPLHTIFCVNIIEEKNHMSYISVIGMKSNINALHHRASSKRFEKGVNRTHVLISLLLVQSSIKINKLRNLKFRIKSNRNIGTFSNENTALVCVYK